MSGQPAARITDSVVKGKIVTGSRTVLIGSQGPGLLRLPGRYHRQLPVNPSSAPRSCWAHKTWTSPCHRLRCPWPGSASTAATSTPSTARPAACWAMAGTCCRSSASACRKRPPCCWTPAAASSPSTSPWPRAASCTVPAKTSGCCAAAARSRTAAQRPGLRTRAGRMWRRRWRAIPRPSWPSAAMATPSGALVLRPVNLSMALGASWPRSTASDAASSTTTATARPRPRTSTAVRNRCPQAAWSR